ncbi:MAG: DinB family protein [Acidimicrobiales bacterium]
MTDTTTHLDQERADLLETLGKHRQLFRFTVEGLTDEQAALTPTASELCVGGLIKHVAFVESGWVDFIEQGTSALEGGGEGDYLEHTNSFRMLPGETLAGILEQYDKVAARTDELVRTLPDLNASHALPAAPWFEPGARWSARRALVHIVAETAQHAGHADILRETIDGQKSMG